MDLATQINSLVDAHVHSLLVQISKKFGISLKELKNVRVTEEDDDDELKVVATKTEVGPALSAILNLEVKPTKKSSNDEYLSKTIAELKQMCKEKGLPVTGTKPILVARLKEEKASAGVAAAGGSVSDRKTAAKSAVKTATTDVMKKVIEQQETVHVRLNKFGHWEHTTGLVFNNDVEQLVIGIQNNGTGDVDQLTKKEIEICKEYKFKYQIPPNLDTEELDVDVIETDESEDELEPEIEEEEVE